jgi:Uma2 family endonuclease
MTPATTPQPATYTADASIAKFSAARYDRMVEAGILTSEDRVELLENYVVLKMANNPPHAGTIQIVGSTLRRHLPVGWDLRCQLPVALPDSRPEPDYAIVKGDARTYLTQHPTPADVGLIIEVANTSLIRDQRDKARIYARGNIVSYWIVNLDDQRVEIHTQPSGPCDSPAYGSVVNYNPGDSIPVVLDGNTVATIAVNDLLP